MKGHLGTQADHGDMNDHADTRAPEEGAPSPEGPFLSGVERLEVVPRPTDDGNASLLDSLMFSRCIIKDSLILFWQHQTDKQPCSSPLFLSLSMVVKMSRGILSSASRPKRNRLA